MFVDVYTFLSERKITYPRERSISINYTSCFRFISKEESKLEDTYVFIFKGILIKKPCTMKKM